MHKCVCDIVVLIDHCKVGWHAAEPGNNLSLFLSSNVTFCSSLFSIRNISILFFCWLKQKRRRVTEKILRYEEIKNTNSYIAFSVLREQENRA